MVQAEVFSSHKLDAQTNPQTDQLPRFWQETPDFYQENLAKLNQTYQLQGDEAFQVGEIHEEWNHFVSMFHHLSSQGLESTVLQRRANDYLALYLLSINYGVPDKIHLDGYKSYLKQLLASQIPKLPLFDQYLDIVIGVQINDSLEEEHRNFLAHLFGKTAHKPFFADFDADEQEVLRQVLGDEEIGHQFWDRRG